MEENSPLMERYHAKERLSLQQTGKDNPAFKFDLAKVTQHSKEYWEDEFNEDRIIFSDDKKRGTSLIWNDFFILTLEYLQWLALIQSLALRWPWPETWIKNMVGIFAFNLDVWEIFKVSSDSTYKSVQEFTTDTSLMPFKYWHFLAIFGGVLLILICTYCAAYCVINKLDHPYLMVKIANLQRALIVTMQIFALPVGAALGKLFHCVPDRQGIDNVMYADDTLNCMSDTHWIHMAVAMAVAVVFYIVFPVWLIKKVKLELIFSHSSGHEAHLQLKETEYVQGLDVVYVVSGFHVFSSFKLRSAHYRAAMHILKLAAIILYSTMFLNTFYQVLALTSLMFLYFLCFAILRPYRVKEFNALLCLNFFCLVLNLLTGALRSSFDVYSLRSVWFTPAYTTWTLIAINSIWLAITLAMFIYLVLHQFSVFRQPLWPSLTSDGVEKLDEHTKKYMRSVLVARHVVERAMSVHPLFAPAHELSRQIQIINAYCREAELLSSPLQDTLWHLLDELIEVHSQIAPRSLFADSVKESIRSTANGLMQILPQFTKRLAQREYDFLFMSPVKRRLLLKMYCMGLFLNGRTDKIKAREANKQALERVWTQDRPKKKMVDYLRTLQPDSELGPRVNQKADLDSQDSISFFTADSVSVDMDYMLSGIKTRPAGTEQAAAAVQGFRLSATAHTAHSGSSSFVSEHPGQVASRHSLLSHVEKTSRHASPAPRDVSRMTTAHSDLPETVGHSVTEKGEVYDATDVNSSVLVDVEAGEQHAA